VLLEMPAPAISVLVVPCRVPPAPDTSFANATNGRRRMTEDNKVRLLSTEHHLSQV
jgi:hypothetical protein